MRIFNEPVLGLTRQLEWLRPMFATLGSVGVSALGIWLGLQVLRTFLSVVVWNLRENLPPLHMVLVVLIVCITCAAARYVRRLAGKAWHCVCLACLFGFTVVLNQAIAHPVADRWLAPVALVVWFWWLPACWERLTRCAVAHCFVPGLLLGIAADMSLRGALHGLDLPFLRGVLPVIGMTLLVALFVAFNALLQADKENTSAIPTLPSSPGRPASRWSLALLGPYLFLQLHVLGNPGQVQMLTGWELAPAVALTLIGLLMAATAIGRTTRFAICLALPCIALLLIPNLNFGIRSVLIMIAQVGSATGLSYALQTVTPRTPRQIYDGCAVGSLTLFALLFLYYCPPNYAWRPLWLVAAAAIVIPVLSGTGSTPPPLAWKGLLAWSGVPLVGAVLAAHSIPAPQTDLIPEHVKVLTYNIHHGFDARSVPSLQQQAAFIEERNPGLVALQEVGRGDPDNGGVDVISYLKWRLPQYRVVYGPTSDDLSGNAILSRYPISANGFIKFPLRGDNLQRGLTWVTVPTRGLPVLFISTHLTVYSPQGREAQAKDVLSFRAKRPHAIIAGDLNAKPETPPMQVLRAGGLRDAAEAVANNEQPTIPVDKPRYRIDYVWLSRDLKPLAARTLPVSLSDHLPLEVNVKLPLQEFKIQRKSL